MNDETEINILDTPDFGIPAKDRLYTPQDVMDLLNIKPTKFRRLCRHADFAPSIELNLGGENRVRRWLKSDLDKWIEERKKK